jgi:hypothetical protein
MISVAFVAVIAATVAPAAHAVPPVEKVTRLSGFQEVPALVVKGTGSASLRVAGSVIHYRLSYADLTSAVTQAHIHIGQDGVNGGVAAFLCSNLPSPPAGTPACPAAPATLTGTIRAAQVIGPAAQGINPGELGKVVRALRAGTVYVNVHSATFPAGELRGDVHHRFFPH